MEETTQPTPAQAKNMSKEERSRIMSEAAKRRWAKARKVKAAKVALKAAPKALPPKKKSPPPPREFSSALKTAEKRLAKAILERAEVSAKYAMLNAKYAMLSAEIPSLQRLVAVLRNPLGAIVETGMPVVPTLEQIVDDQPLQYRNPPRMPAIPTSLHPANLQSRAGGGAIGLELEEQGDDDQFLRSSAVAGGEWR